MVNWPRIESIEEEDASGSKTKYHCWSETIMPCGKSLKVKQSGYDRGNVKRRAEAALGANARRHLRSCKTCKIG